MDSGVGITLPEVVTPEAPTPTRSPTRPSGVDREAAARRAFSTSMLVSATRCLLTYVVLPFLAPMFGIAADVGPGLGIAIGVAAIGSNVLTIRRFHAARHRWRWGYTAIAVSVMALLLVLMVRDIADLIG